MLDIDRFDCGQCFGGFWVHGLNSHWFYIKLILIRQHSLLWAFNVLRYHTWRRWIWILKTCLLWGRDQHSNNGIENRSWARPKVKKRVVFLVANPSPEHCDQMANVFFHYRYGFSQQLTLTQKHTKFAKVLSELCQILNLPPKYSQIILNLCPNGEI